jgi:hypothetical protein
MPPSLMHKLTTPVYESKCTVQHPRALLTEPDAFLVRFLNCKDNSTRSRHSRVGRYTREHTLSELKGWVVYDERGVTKG